MTKHLTMGGLVAMCVVALGAGLYLRADADTPRDGLPEPQVPGRLTAVLHSDGSGFSATIVCEFDARVTIADGNVRSIDIEGTNTRVEHGEKVVEDWEGPPVMVHRGDDGLLHIGCAPESQKLE